MQLHTSKGIFVVFRLKFNFVVDSRNYPKNYPKLRKTTKSNKISSLKCAPNRKRADIWGIHWMKVAVLTIIIPNLV